MTFTELQTIVQREVVSDRNEAVFTASGEILPILKNVSTEIAAMLGFPQELGTDSLTDGATTITAPADMLAAQLGQVMIGDWDVRPSSYVEVLRQRRRSSGVPVVYNYDPRRGGNIEFGPSLSGSATAQFEYTKFLDPTSMTDAEEAWDGRFPQWHWLIPVRSGINLNRALQDYERVQHYFQEFQSGLQAFSAFLGVPAPQIALQESGIVRRQDSVAGA